MSPEEMFEEANRLEESGNEHGALYLWRELSKAHPEPIGLCRHAWLAEELGEEEEAINACQLAIGLDRNFAAAYEGLGSMAIHRRAYEDAEQFLRKATDLGRTEWAYCMLGVALRGVGRVTEARQSYLTAIEIDPEFEEPYYNLGVLLSATDPSEARDFFAKALHLDPDYAEAHSELGWSLKKHGSLPEAEYHLRRAIELKPENAWTHVYLANLLWHRGDVPAAITEFEWAREAAPDHAFPRCPSQISMRITVNGRRPRPCTSRHLNWSQIVPKLI